MKLSTGLLLPALASAASAISDANVYIFQGDEFPNTSTPPALTPEEARLVFAQRLGVSEYHGLGDASESALAYINKFGGPQETLFQSSAQDKAAELILFIEGISSKTAEQFLSAWSSIRPAFTISNPPSSDSNRQLAKELQAQVGNSPECRLDSAINPFDKACWNGQSKIEQYTLVTESYHKNYFEWDMIKTEDLRDAQKRLVSFAKNDEMNVVVVVMPEECQTIKDTPSPYGKYDMPQAPLGRRQAEEIMTEEAAASSASPVTNSKQFKATNETIPLLPLPAWCYASLNACNNGTNSCSSHGECKEKTAKEGERPACWACDCGFGVLDKFNLNNDPNRPAQRAIQWGGAACQKKDISGPFWLFAGFTVVIIGLISWAIGMLFSIGEEKLPGVIGAGVSSKVR